MTVSFPDITPDPAAAGRPLLRQRDYLVVHYTGVSVRFNDPTKDVDYSREVCRYLRWEYNYHVGLGGGTFSQGGDYMAGHSKYFNDDSVGVLFMNAVGVPPTQAQIAAFHQLRKALVARGILKASHEVIPHYGVRSTGCPGNMLAEVPGGFKNSPIGDGRGRFGQVIPELRQPLTATVPTAPPPTAPIPAFPPFVPAWGLFSLYPWATNKPVIRLGSHGDIVRYVQGVLKAKMGYAVIIDGEFGGQTDAAVRKYQTSRRLFVDGIVGPQTWKSIDADAK